MEVVPDWEPGVAPVHRKAGVLCAPSVQRAADVPLGERPSSSDRRTSESAPAPEQAARQLTDPPSAYPPN